MTNFRLLKVPLLLGIRVSSICGTIRVCMKPPPSDQIWFGFTSMPDIQINLESFVGDHKITNARLALFLISRFKVRSFINKRHVMELFAHTTFLCSFLEIYVFLVLEA